ncbi:aspartate aminotransferase family protein [Cyclobacterium marinum]|uniref:Acetylornithine aminotransferase n=1 Tax=Cyclobacterium marinum (strain ATCC 25205 / DSM 745 / LMG 13164 / NCIMB 1802) TaxID=880070 RepID=G0J6C6_CYCMS|nr:aspartate aminotransferase family protein [Cyclobacterium marinum]AEL27621.1 Acetylornithine/succinyldiaminopimelateaminotran sferase [Cyclobacterium marinum DSM 745]
MHISNEYLYEEDKKNYLPTFKRFPLAFIKGKGSRLWDADGKEYIDMLAGIAVNNLGHCHPKVVKAVQDQAAELMHISNFFVSPPQVAVSKLLVDLTGLKHVFLTNSGAESVEGAIKIARKYAHKRNKGGEIISMKNSFHGRTLATIATGQKKYQQGFAPIPTGFSQVAFNDINALKAALNENTAAVILEPIQGEGGIVPAEKEYLEEVRQLCDEQDILLIFDEIQCGIGRTGKLFAKEHFEIQPDIMTLAKGLGGGMSVGALLCNEKVGDAIDYGDHGTTFGGNPMASAAALATLKAILEEGLVERALEKGNWIMNTVKSWKTKHAMIKEVRGMGLMIGIVLDRPAAPFVKALLDDGIIVNGTAETVIRLVPPLNIPDEDVNTVLEKLEKLIGSIEQNEK